MVDHYSWYTQAEWIKNKQPEEVIKALMKKWISVFGKSKKIMTDNGREFQNENMRNLIWNMEMMTTAAESPVSKGRCEKTVGLKTQET